jgi:hypothetical protein
MRVPGVWLTGDSAYAAKPAIPVENVLLPASQSLGTAEPLSANPCTPSIHCNKETSMRATALPATRSPGLEADLFAAVPELVTTLG